MQFRKAFSESSRGIRTCKELLNQWDTVSAEDKSVFTDRLDKDLSKALNVAKEIENAKQLVEEYHDKANKHNYEKLEDDTKKKK